MIYIGDGMTDVPCMKLVKVNGGQSIAVYPKGRGKKESVQNLLLDQRVDYISLANYEENSELDKIVKSIIPKMVATDRLVEIHRKQITSAEGAKK